MEYADSTVSLTWADGAAVVTCAGELDAAVPQLDTELTRALEDGATALVVDLLAVTFIDSSVVRSLLQAQQVLQDRGGALRLVYSHHMIGKVLQICGVTDLLPRASSVSAALASEAREVAE